MSMQKLLRSVVTMSLLAGVVIASAGAYKLAFSMKKGQRLKYKMKTSTEQSMEMMGREMSSSVNGATVMHLEVEDVTKTGDITFVYAIDSMQTQVKNAMMGMDSTFINPAGIIGKRTRFTMSAAGKKLNSVIVDSVKLTGVMAQMSGGRQNTFTLIELSGKEMKAGESWTTNKVDTMNQAGGKMMVTTATTYTVGNEVDTLGYKCVRLMTKGKASIKGEGAQMGAKLFFEGEGPTSGIVYFAPKEGLLVAMTSDSDLEMTIAVTGPQNMTIPQTTATKTSLVLVK